MKLTKKQENAIYTNRGVLRNDVKMAKSVLRNETFRPTQSSHRGGRGTVRDVTANVKSLLKVFGYKHTSGNDAPKGGLNGNFIKISKVASKNIHSLK